MNELRFFSFVPHLKDYTIQPSPDRTTELKLILTNTGACIGISYAEQKILALIDGVNNIGQIVCRIDEDAIASFSVLKTLLRDLDRYGFLSESPWHIEETSHFGYWGISTAYTQQITMNFQLGGVEKIIARICFSPLLAVLSLVISMILFYFNLPMLQTLLLHQDSLATAGVLVLSGSVMAVISLNLLYALILTGIYPTPITWMIDLQYGFPIIRIDARRLCTLSCMQSCFVILSPVFVVFLVTNGCFWASVITNQFYDVVGLICCGVYVHLVLILSPWFSTIFSREVSMRLRHNHVKHSLWTALRLLFLPRSKNNYNQLFYGRLYTVWGLWSLIYSACVLALIYPLFWVDYKTLGQQMIQDEQYVAVYFVFGVIAIVAASLCSSLLVMVLNQFNQLMVNIRKWYWPNSDNLLALLGIAASCIGLFPYMYLTQLNHELQLGAGILLAATVVIVMIVVRWYKEGWSYEGTLHASMSVLAISFLLRGFAWISELTEIQIEIDYTNQPIDYSNIYHNASNGMLMIGVIAYLGYLVLLHRYWFRLPQIHQPLLFVKILAIGFSLGLMVGLWYYIPFEATLFGFCAKVLFLCIGIYLVLSLLWIGSFRNGSITIITLALLLMLSGNFWSSDSSLLILEDYAILLAMLLIMVGYFFRASAVVKTALGFNLSPSDLKPIREWQANDLYEEIKKAVIELYGVPVAIKLPDEDITITLRESLVTLHKIIGTEAIHAITRRVTRNIPWYESQSLVSILPIKVTFPSLNQWNKVKIQSMVSSISYLKNCQNDELSEVMNSFRLAVFFPGDVLIKQAKVEKDLFIILDGLVCVEQEQMFNQRVIAMMGQDDYVGEIGFLTEKPRTATVRAIKPTITLCLHRKDVLPNMRSLFQKMLSADLYHNWQFYLKRSNLFAEFSAPLNERVFLESKRLVLEQQQSIDLTNQEYHDQVIVFLAGEATLVIGNHEQPLQEGQLLGLNRCFYNNDWEGRLEISMPSKFLIIDQNLLKKALIELLTPEEFFQIPLPNHHMHPVLLKGRYRFT